MSPVFLGILSGIVFNILFVFLGFKFGLLFTIKPGDLFTLVPLFYGFPVKCLKVIFVEKVLISTKTMRNQYSYEFYCFEKNQKCRCLVWEFRFSRSPWFLSTQTFLLNIGVMEYYITKEK
jgi:hypothetical protein